jgi:hypothetical protein
MTRVTSNFNTPPFKKFTLATVLNYNSARVHPALLCANHTEQGKYIGQDMPAARTTKAIKNQVTCSLSARKGAQCGHGASFSLPPSTPKQYTFVAVPRIERML